jgi:hypothetical protein
LANVVEVDVVVVVVDMEEESGLAKVCSDEFVLALFSPSDPTAVPELGSLALWSSVVTSLVTGDGVAPDEPESSLAELPAALTSVSRLELSE